ncbi:MAG: phospho-sugar mutase, partial [Clostridia bacterium]|nr:phospho-sugar mutase [Clostridia bacterium]
LGAGTHRMNVYTVGKATQGLADYLNADFVFPSVVIGYDSRINSDKFARIAAEVLAANGIKVYIFPELMPTPIVAYAVKELGCSSGIIITASHNPSKYNGYKCYDARGYQMTDEAAAKTLDYINACDVFDSVHRIDFDEAEKLGIIKVLSADFLDKYFELVKKCSVRPDAPKNSGLSVIYTPLNGTGNKQVRRVLKEVGFEDVTVVPSQELPDGNFPTCPFPNPEIKEAFGEALKLSETKKADLLLATDPDCDRVGIAVLANGEYKLLTGNDVGCLLTDYILSCRKAAGTLPKDPVVIKSIVSTDMSTAIAESYGAKVINVLTGFKYIGEKMTELENAGEADRFMIGFEESYGYLTGMHTKDKDAVNASMLICEMAAFYKKQGKTLLDVMESLYERFGFWKNSLFNFYFEGADGMAKMTAIMEQLRGGYPETLGEKTIVKATDYKTRKETCLKTGKTSDVTLPVSNVIVLEAENRDKIIVRPAGTEPKLKIYTMVQGKNEREAEARTEEYKSSITKLLGIEE